MKTEDRPEPNAKYAAFIAQLRLGKLHRDALQSTGLSWREFSTAMTRDPSMAREYQIALAHQRARSPNTRERHLRENLAQLIWQDIAIANQLLQKRKWLGPDEDFRFLPIERVAMLNEDGLNFRAEIDAAKRGLQKRREPQRKRRGKA